MLTFTSSKQDAGAVAKALLQEIIPMWGIPGKMSSDNRAAFVRIAFKQVSDYLEQTSSCLPSSQCWGSEEREVFYEG